MSMKGFWRSFERVPVFGLGFFICLAASATEYFVDCNRPDDSGDGMSEATAKRTIQAAVDLTKNGDIVTVLPGVYKEGRGISADGTIEARVAITNQVWLRSRDGRDVTHIVGEKAGDAFPAGLRCVYMAMYAMVEGFTIRGGAAAGNKNSTGRGAAVYGSYRSYSYVCDCVIRDNSSAKNACVCSVRAVSCQIVNNENTSSSGGGAMYDCSAYNTLIAQNRGGSCTFSYAREMVNVSVIYNQQPVIAYNDGGKFCNSIIISSASSYGSADMSEQRCNVMNLSGIVGFKVEENTKQGASVEQFLAPAFNDWRLLSTSDGTGRGKDEYLTVINLYHSNEQWDEYLEKTYRYRDCAGSTIPADSENINCGAFAQSVTPRSGRVNFAGSSVTLAFPGKFYPNTLSYAYAETYPTQFCVKAVFNSGKSLFMYEFKPMYDIYSFFPEMDGYFRFTPPPKDSTVTLTPKDASCELYVDADNGSDDNDGSSKDKAFETLQAAIDAASGSYYDRTLIHAAPGIYDKGGTFNGSLSNRIDNLSKTLYIRADEGPEKTFIVGAADPDTKGYGPNAVRCVKWYHSGRIGCLQGFTLTGGYTDDGDSYAESRIAAGYFGSFEHLADCVISNNHAICIPGSLNGVVSRCTFSDNTAKLKWIVSGPKSMSHCLIKDSKFLSGSDAAVTRQGVYRFCTVDGAGFASTDERSPAFYYGCVFERAASTFDNCTFEDCFAESSLSPTEIPGISVGELHMVGGKDRRLLTISPAYGAVGLENPAWHYSYFTSDLSGVSPYWNGAAMTAGAYSRPLQAFSVRGPKDALSVVGTNGVEFAGTVTVTAQAIRPRNGAKFLGFTVNGTDCPADRLSYEISGAEPEGIVEIVARYMPVGLNLFFR